MSRWDEGGVAVYRGGFSPPVRGFLWLFSLFLVSEVVPGDFVVQVSEDETKRLVVLWLGFDCADGER